MYPDSPQRESLATRDYKLYIITIIVVYLIDICYASLALHDLATIFNDSLPEKDYQTVIEALQIEICEVQNPSLNTQRTAKQLRMSP